MALRVPTMSTSLAAGPVNQAGRPLLARVAESVFWASRYVERAEHLARVAYTTSDMTFDAGDLSDELRDKLWLGILDAFNVPHPEACEPGYAGEACLRQLVHEPETGIVASVGKARENARSVRGEVSSEMWKTLNELYWSLAGENAAHALGDAPEEFFDHVVRGSMLFQGVTDQTLAHGQRWDFALVGRLLERADATCRIIASRSRFLEVAGGRLETPLRNIQLLGALRMCCSIEAYRQHHPTDLDLRQVVAFLLLRAEHPRTVRFAITAASRAVHRIRQSSGNSPYGDGNVDPAERLLGQLAARLQYSDAADLAQTGIDAFLADVRNTVARVNNALHKRYFAA